MSEPGDGNSSDDRDPLNPEAWYAEPNVCGSCIAWRPENQRPGEEVASGSCRLRRELPRVPATLRKCSLYKPRGKFVYQPTKEPKKPKRRKAAAVRVLKRDESGEMVQTSAPTPTKILYRDRPPTPREVDVGTDNPRTVRSVLKELYLADIPPSGRELHGRFEGGRVQIVNAAGKSREIEIEVLFRILDRFRTTLDALEDALVRKDQLLPQFEEMQKQLRSVQGSFTTFNILFDDRADYFSGKVP